MVCHGRFQRWRDAGVWARIVEAVLRLYDGNVVLIDATSVAVPPCWHSAACAVRDPVSWVTPRTSGSTFIVHRSDNLEVLLQRERSFPHGDAGIGVRGKEISRRSYDGCTA